jgi:PucR C-terminal helix-turn-helix domain
VPDSGPALPDSTRDRLSETLRSWLMNMGNRTAVAVELHVHPQTVRYQLGRPRELFGPAQEGPTTRAALLLALAWAPAASESDLASRVSFGSAPLSMIELARFVTRRAGRVCGAGRIWRDRTSVF